MYATEKGLSKSEIITECLRSPHAALQEYIPIIGQSANEDQEFTAHLVSYTALKGQVRDAHTALPIVTLSCSGFSAPEFVENSLAHLARLSPRDLVTAYRFARGYVKQKDIIKGDFEWKDATGKVQHFKQRRLGGWKKFGSSPIAAANRRGVLDLLVTRYLRAREANPRWLERSIVQYRSWMQDLYFLSHTDPDADAKDMLYNRIRPRGSALEAIKNLPLANPQVAAAEIMKYKIPFLMLFPILGEKAKDRTLLMAIIERMSSSDLQTNMAVLEKLGVKDYPETRAALEEGLKKVALSGKNTLKTTRAASRVTDEKIKSQLSVVQEKQLGVLEGIKGDWLLLIDASSSMQNSVEAGKEIAAYIARMTTGRVTMEFFTDSPRYFDATGKSLEEIKDMTKYITANGWTCVGCGLQDAIARGLNFDGIVIISDGQENRNPPFAFAFHQYRQKTGNDPAIYYFKMAGNQAWGMDTLEATTRQNSISMTTIDLRGKGVDSYSMVNVAPMLKVRKNAIIDEVLAAPLLTVEGVLAGGFKD